MASWSQDKRNARARALGFRNYSAMRKAGQAARDAARAEHGDTTNQKRADKTREQNAEQRASAADAVTPLRNGELTSSALSSVLRAAINRAASADRRLSAVVTVKLEDGRLRDVRLWQVEPGPGGDHRYAAENLKQDVADYGGVKPAFLHHVNEALRVATKSGGAAVAESVEHVDLTATD